MIKKAKDQKLTVAPSPLEVNGDSVKFSLNAVLPAGLLRKNKLYNLSPTFKYGDQKVVMPDWVFKAEDYPKSKKELVKASKVYAFAYSDPLMNKGLLFVQGSATNINGKGKKSAEIEVAQGTITTARLVEYSIPPVQVDFGYTAGDEVVPTTIDFFFEQGESTLRSSEIKGSRGQFLDNFIAAKNLTKTVAITGSHSPEGREAKNVSLSEDRAKAIEKYYRAKINEFTYGPVAKPSKRNKAKRAVKPSVVRLDSSVQQIQYVTKSLIEDWRPFVDTLNAFSGFSEAEKAEILSVVNSKEGTFAVKEVKRLALSTYLGHGKRYTFFRLGVFQ
jgi:outer membrane protein OmpA-like peptidoglycan-associated protein